MVGVCDEEVGCWVLAVCGQSTRAEHTHTKIDAETEKARQDFIARSSGEA
jgi:hypothetical protein